MANTLQLFTASSGHPSARILFEDDTVRHLHSTVAPEKESRYFDHVRPWGDIVLLAGTGLGYHLDQFAKQLPPSTAIVVVDYYQELAEKASQRLLGTRPCNSTVLWNGCPRESQLAHFLSARSHGSLQIVRHPAAYNAHPEFYEGVIDTLRRLLQHEGIERGKKSQSPDAHNGVLLMHSTFFLEPELAAAVMHSDRPVHRFDYGLHQSPLSFDSALQQVLESKRPSDILSVNMKGFDAESSLALNAKRRGIPIRVWFVDDPRPIVYPFRDQIDSSMVAACWERAYLPFLKECGFGTVIHLPLAGDPAFGSSGPIRQRAVLGFVGSSMGEPFLAPMRERFLWSDSLAPLVDEVSEQILADPEFAINGNIVTHCSNKCYELPFNDSRNQVWLWSYCIHTASRKRRLRTVSAAGPAGLELFGDPDGWRQLVGDSLCLHPSVDYATQLANTYASIAINLTITSSQMPTAVNQRVFDVPLAGSFLLSDAQPELFELFDQKNETVVYSDPGEIPDLVSFYANHPSARKTISDRARKRVLAEHTYSHRVQLLLKAH